MLFADRTSTAYLRSNTATVLLFCGLRVVEMLRRLAGRTELAKAQCVHDPVEAVKDRRRIRISVRKVWVSLAGGYPYVALFRQVHEKLCAVPLKAEKERSQ